MQLEKLDEEYIVLVKDIIDNKEFLKLKECEHHGISRFDHSLKVSYKAYTYSKKHKLDAKAVARAGLLHDFFITNKMNHYEKFKSTFKHPSQAYLNAFNLYNINALEKDIICSHMFPIGNKIPKHKESWIVSFFDKTVALKEFSLKFNHGIKYAINIVLLILLNFIK